MNAQIYLIALIILPFLSFFLGIWVQYRYASIRVKIKDGNIDIDTFNIRSKNVKIIDRRTHDEYAD